MNFQNRSTVKYFLKNHCFIYVLNSTTATQDMENGGVLAKVAWWVKTLAANSDDLTLVPRTHMV